MVLGLLVASSLAAAAQATAASKQVRVFAASPKLSLDWMESRETYRDKMFALVDRELRGGAAPPVQRGADDVASHLLGPADPARPVGTARDLLVWPEDIGLFAALTGERAAPARASGSLEGSIATLISLYGPQNDFYAQRYPELAARVPPTRLLALSLTDTFGRVVIETFSEMAERYDVWLETGVIMARSWQVVCTDQDAFNSAQPHRLPGGVRCAEQNPEKVARLRDPFEPERDYAYEATTDKPSTMALVFDPDGRLVSKQQKVYYVPVELGETEGQLGLDLVPGAVSDGLGAVRTPVGTLGFATSKDAWMPDVMQKLDQQHVDLLVQPEFFVGNLIQPEGMWNPDVLLASGYMDVLRHPSLEALVVPELVGNIFDFSADHQQLIAVKPRTNRGPRGSMVGQPEHRGIVGVSPWVVPDPVGPAEPFPQRRGRLGEAGRKLAPGSGVECPDPAEPGPCENGHVEGVLWRDVRVDRAPRYRRFRGPVARTAFTRSRPVRPSRRPQRNAAVAVRGRHGVVAFEERRRGRDRIFLARTRDGGHTWSRPVRPAGRRHAGTDEWWPAVAIGGRGRVTVAWVDRSNGRARVHFSRSGDGGRSFGAPRALDSSPPPEVAQWRPALAQSAGDTVHAAWIDERTTHPEGLPQAGLWYARIRGGRAEPGRRLDTGAPRALAAKLDNAWAPSVATRGSRVLVAWIDFENYDWDVFARLSSDGGEGFGPQMPVNDTPEDDPSTEGDEQEEALNDTPSAALTKSSALVAWTDWRKRDSAAERPHSAYDIYLAEPGGRNRQIDPYGGRQVSTFSPSACVSGGHLLVAFQDASRGQNDIRLVRTEGGRRRGQALRVDDAGKRGGNAWRPRLACSGRRQLVAWEDERDGPAQIYAAVRSRPRPSRPERDASR